MLLVAKRFCVVSVRMNWEGEPRSGWISALFLSPCLYSDRLIKSGNTFFSPKQRGYDWKMTKSANALKISAHGRSRLSLFVRRIFLCIDSPQQRMWVRNLLPWIKLCLSPLPLCVSHVCSHKVPLTSVRKHVGMKCNCLQEGLLQLFLCIPALHCKHCK